MICIERPLGSASALEVLQSDRHPYSATVGLHVEPGPIDSGSQIPARLRSAPRAASIFTRPLATSLTP
jgi:hypothetical protein